MLEKELKNLVTQKGNMESIVTTISSESLKLALNLEHSMQRRNSLGGCGSDEVKRQIHILLQWLRSIA